MAQKKTKITRAAKKRSTKDQQGLIAIIALAIVAILGVGYAAITSTLTIGGSGTEATAVPDSTAFDINYTANTVASISTDGTGTVSDTTGASNYPTKTVSFTATGMSKMNETATVTYTITNASADLGASLGTPTCSQTDTGGYFEITTSLGSSTLTKASGGSNTTSQTVMVKLVKLPVDNNVSTTITCTLQATATN